MVIYWGMSSFLYSMSKSLAVWSLVEVEVKISCKLLFSHYMAIIAAVKHSDRIPFDSLNWCCITNPAVACEQWLMLACIELHARNGANVRYR